MTLDQYRLDGLIEERKSIAKFGRLHWLHWTVVGLSLVITVGAWYFVKQQIEEKNRTRFQVAAEQVLELVSERMQKYEDGLWGGVAAIQAHGGDIAYEDWLNYSQSLRIDVKYPGINGIGVIHHIPSDGLDAYLDDQRRSRPDYDIHPQHNETLYLPITYIEPSSENTQAVGLDMAHETNRFTAALKARDTGTAQITGPIVLVQDATRTPGFLFYAPFYSGGIYQSLEKRRDNFVGMVYAPFVFHKLMEGVLGKDKRQVRIRVNDGLDILYDEHLETDQEFDPDPLFRSEFAIDLYGRNWTFDVRSTRAFREGSDGNQPIAILVGGIAIDSLLLTLFVLLSRSNRRAVDFADRVANQLHLTSIDRLRLVEESAKKELQILEERVETEALEISLRKEREKGVLQRKFVSMVSHEFRTPLAIIDGKAHRILRKLDQLAPEAVADMVESIRSSVTRMSALLEQMLTSAKLEAGTIAFEPDLFNLPELIEDICVQQNQINPSHKINRNLSGIPDNFFGDEKLLRQVMTNLLSNAVKYSPDGKLVEIKGEWANDLIRVDIRDYGIGVPEAEIQEIFTHCYRASTSEGIAGTGVGLHLVESFTKLHGGEVTVQSSVGEGSTFTLWLPTASQDTPVTQREAVA